MSDIVYSTDPNCQDEEPEDKQSRAPGEQQLTVRLDTRHRRGKVVTLITGWQVNPQHLKQLGKELKQRCGTGGSAKDNTVLLQGDYREQAADILRKQGFQVKVK